MKISLYQIIPEHKLSDVVYCNGIDCISPCIKDLYNKGFKSFTVNFLGEYYEYLIEI